MNTARVPRYESLPTGGRVYTGPQTMGTVRPQFPHVTPTKSVTPGPAYLGQPKTWQITLTGDGTATAASVSAVDTLPVDWT